MQTFLTHGADFRTTAHILDRKRLMKQRVETYQIMKVLAGETSGWTRHPAVLMWRGYPQWLLSYQFAITEEVLRRGYEDTTLDKTIATMLRMGVDGGATYDNAPPWINDQRIANSHRYALYIKDPEHYAAFYAPERPETCCDRCNYYWPSHVVRKESLV